MDYDEFAQKLQDYTDYCSGDLSKKCALEVTEETINCFDFSKFDIASSSFADNEFESCNFTNVDFSSAFFSGSIFHSCCFENNRIVKAEWNYTAFYNCLINSLYAFRAEFYHSKIINCKLIDCSFMLKTYFNSSEFENTSFNRCVFEDGCFGAAKFSMTGFVECRFKEQDFCITHLVNMKFKSEESMLKEHDYSSRLHIANSAFYSCQFEKIHLTDWISSRDEFQIIHKQPIFEGVIFRNCQFIDCDLPNDFDLERAASDEGYCYSTH